MDLRGLHTTPLLHGPEFNAAAHLVFSASGHDVADVWVDGHRLVESGEVKSVDVGRVRATAQAAAEELFDRVRRLRERGEVPTPPSPAPHQFLSDPTKHADSEEPVQSGQSPAALGGP